MGPEVTLVWPEVIFMAPKLTKIAKKPWFLEFFEIFVFQSQFWPWIRSKFKNRATSCTQPGFVAYSCKFSRRYVKPIVLGAANKVNPQFATVTLKLGQGQKFCSQTVAQGKIFGYTNFCLAPLKTLSLRSIRVWKKNGNADYLNLLKSPSVICVNNKTWRNKTIQVAIF